MTLNTEIFYTLIGGGPAGFLPSPLGELRVELGNHLNYEVATCFSRPAPRRRPANEKSR
jgi:hypothetical protein